MPQIPRRWSSPQPQVMVPSPLDSCSPAGSCSCLCCVVVKDATSRLWGRKRTPEPARCECHTHRRRAALLDRALRQPSPSKQPSRTRRALQLISPFFPGCVHPLYGSAHSGATDLHTRYRPQVLAPLLQSEKGMLLEIRLEQLPGALVQLWLGAGSVLGRQRSALLCEFGVALDR